MFSSIFVLFFFFFGLRHFRVRVALTTDRLARFLNNNHLIFFRKSRTNIIIIIVRPILKVVCNKRFLLPYAGTHFLTEIAVIWPIQFFSACDAYIHNIIFLAVRVVVTVAGCFACHAVP